MKIVFFCRLFKPHIGGVEKHVYQVSQELIKQGHIVSVITERYDKVLAEKEVIDDISIYRIPIKENWFKKFVIWQWMITHKSIFATADVLHFHDVFYWFLPLKFFNFHKKVFVTFHGYEGNNLPSRKAILMHRMAEKLTNGNICIGGFQKKWYGTHPTIISYGAIIPTKKLSRTVSKFQAVFVGRLEEEAGVMMYLKAMKILKEKKIIFPVMILGDGVLRDECEKYARQHGLDVIFKGFVDDVDKYIAQATIVFTSRYLGILEAMSHNKFVFAVYNNRIKKDYLSITPFSKNISISGEELSLANAVFDYRKNPNKFKKQIDEGKKWVDQQTWENMVNLYLQLWKKR